jgi:crossover junction endodeoxyribonuclease RuvC
MTLRITFGVDPGLAGAIVTLLDGEPGPMLDMPVTHDKNHNEVDAARIADFVRQVKADNPGAFAAACIEKVRAMPNRQGGERRTMGAQSMFNFGDGFGQVKAVFRVMRVPVTLVEAQSWKRVMGLIGTDKDMARQLAIRRFPQAAEQLKRKKDGGRGDALLIALYHDNTQMMGSQAA